MNNNEKSLALPTGKPDLIRDMNDLLQLSGVLVKSGLLPAQIKTPEAAAVIILKGRELGIGPMEAFAGINVIQGKPTVAPALMLALINRSEQLQDLSIDDNGHTCSVIMTRLGRKPHREDFSMEDAKAMGLADRDNWRKQPKTMRKWRAVSACARVVFPDVIEGMYLPEELGAEVNEEGEVIEVQALPPTPTPQPEPASAAAAALPPLDTAPTAHLTPGPVIPSKKGDAIQLLRSLEVQWESTLAKSQPQSEDQIKKARQLTTMRLAATARDGSDSARHKVTGELFPGKKGLTDLEPKELYAFRDWLPSDLARAEVQKIVATLKQTA